MRANRSLLNCLLVTLTGIGVGSCVLPEYAVTESLDDDNDASVASDDDDASDEEVDPSNPGDDVTYGCDAVHPSAPIDSFAACSEGYSCYLGSSDSFCAPAGSEGLDDDCENDSDCAPGMFCDADYDYVCNRWCYDANDCPDDGICYPVYTYYGLSLGMCEW